MKITRCLATAFLLIGLHNAQAQQTTPDALVQRLFATLQAKDENAYVKLYPNGQQMGRMVRGLMEQMFQSEEMKAAMAADPAAKNLNLDSLVNAQVSQMSTPEAETKMREKFADNHKKVIDQGQKRGINWSEARLTSVALDSTSGKGDQEAQMMEKAGLKAMNAVIDFNAGGTDYQVNVEKMIYIPAEGGWFGGDLKQVVRKGEKFNSADEAGAATEAPKAESKTKVKTKDGETKTKTKASSGKTTTKTKSKTKV